MQFPYRMAWVLGLIIFVIFIQGFWKTTEGESAIKVFLRCIQSICRRRWVDWISVCKRVFVHGILEEDQGSKILRLLAALETHVSEYLSEIRSLRSEIALLRDDGETETSHTDADNSGGKDASWSASPRSNGHSSKVMKTLLSKNRLKLVNLYNALPHLLDSEDALIPALTIGKQRGGGKWKSACNFWVLNWYLKDS